MYTFVDTTVSQGIRAPVEPVDNMSINGVPLNQLVEGYRHLTVTGRGLLGQSVKSTSVPGRRGVWVEDVSDDERMLEIKYQLEARTSADMRDKFAKLNRILRTLASSGYLEITFKDEPTYTYYGYFSGADDIEEKSLSIVSKFTLIVPDGYKKKNAQDSTGLISLSDALEVLPESITVTPTGTVNQVQIINGTKVLSFSGSYVAGKDIVVTFGDEEVTATYNGRSILSELERFSPLEQFTVKNGDRITARNATVKNVVWRDERA
ncbi:distal tail protein Dit [Streptococcus suis]|uniref:distal tail protein Dit n=1 Tax=Streptococcus suis TaxID=1307 RepID=UPI00287421C4|nr:distal tail protein Dit [Streptococcus suis]MDS1161647.1 phage tail family protein [Streptococcus suis]